ncbi:MAG: hypothetical protein D6690_18035 [Nitrospirae bacterium]|nr:MAG: hypothetical protein D6690_18035 [Nitrospirota bacterium]
MNPIIQLILTALISGAMVSSVMGVIFHRYLTRVEQEIKSQRAWKEEAVSELLGPVNMQLDRTKRTFDRWTSKNLYLEAKVIKEGNQTIRDLLLTKGHLIPPELLEDAGKLIEHYDVWLEKFEKQRLAEKPDLESPFTFVGPEGYPFPRQSAHRFQAKFQEYWKELYGS